MTVKHQKTEAFFLLTEQLATSTPESLLDEIVRAKVSFMGQCKECTTKECEKKKYAIKQHRNKSQDVVRVLKENRDGKINEKQKYSCSSLSEINFCLPHGNKYYFHT